MPMCSFHPCEPSDRVCARCLHERLRYLSRREGAIRRAGDAIHMFNHDDADAETSDSVVSDDVNCKESSDFGCYGTRDTEKSVIKRCEGNPDSGREVPGESVNGGNEESRSKQLNKENFNVGSDVVGDNGESGTISYLMKSESQRSQRESYVFYSCSSEVSVSETESKVGAGDTPTLKQSLQAPTVDVQAASCSRQNCCSGEEKTDSFSPPFPVLARASLSNKTDVEIYPEDANSEPVSISALISLSRRETDIKFKKSSSISRYFPGYNQGKEEKEEKEEKSKSFRPVWRLRSLSKLSSQTWRLCFQNPLKSSKVSPGKREVDADSVFTPRFSSLRASYNEARSQACRTPVHTNSKRQGRNYFVPPPMDSVTFACPTPHLRTWRGASRGKASVRNATESPWRTPVVGKGERRGSRSATPTAEVSRRLYDHSPSAEASRRIYDHSPSPQISRRVFDHAPSAQFSRRVCHHSPSAEISRRIHDHSQWKVLVDAINSDIQNSSQAKAKPHCSVQNNSSTGQLQLETHILTWMEGAAVVKQ